MSASGTRNINESTVVQASRDIVFSSLDEDMLAMDERAGFCYSLNSSGARIWHLMQSPTSVGAMCSVLCREFEVDQQTCFEDVSEILKSMLDAGLVRLVADAGTP